MVAAHLSPSIAQRLAAKSVATVRSALVPGLIPRDLSAASQLSRPSVNPAGSRAAANASRQAAASRRIASAVAGAKFAQDVRVGHRGEKRQIDGERRPARVALPPARRRQRRQAERENVFISRDILPRDAIPRPPPPPWPRAASRSRGRSRRAGPRVRGRRDWRRRWRRRRPPRPPRRDCRARRPAPGAARHPRAPPPRASGAHKQDDAEIGVLTDRRQGRGDGARGRGPRRARPSPRSGRRLPRRCERSPQGSCGGRARTDARCLVWARRARRGRPRYTPPPPDLRGPFMRPAVASGGGPVRRSERNAIASATLRALTFCRPLHAGMLLTSSTVGAPSTPPSTSTPAMAAPTASAAARARRSISRIRRDGQGLAALLDVGDPCRGAAHHRGDTRPRRTNRR